MFFIGMRPLAAEFWSVTDDMEGPGFAAVIVIFRSTATALSVGYLAIAFARKRATVSREFWPAFGQKSKAIGEDEIPSFTLMPQ